MAQNVSVRGVSSSASAPCEQPPHPFAFRDLLKWEHTGALHAHGVSRNECTNLLGRYLERLFSPHLLRLVILRYLVSIKNEKSMVFKSQSFNSFYQKCHCGCYFPQKRTLFFGMPALSLAGLQAPCLPAPCLRFALPSRSLAPKWLTSYNLLTRMLFTKTIRNHFQAPVPLTGQTGTFPHVSQLTARRALISSGFVECRAIRGEGCPVPPAASLYRVGQRASRTPTLRVLVSSAVGRVPPRHRARLPLGAVQLLPRLEQTSARFDVRKQR